MSSVYIPTASKSITAALYQVTTEIVRLFKLKSTFEAEWKSLKKFTIFIIKLSFLALSSSVSLF